MAVSLKGSDVYSIEIQTPDPPARDTFGPAEKRSLIFIALGHPH
jgi:hypothetical protein